MLKQRFLVQFGSGVFLKALGMFSTIIVARYAGPEVLGQVAYGMAYASLFTMITGLWGTPHIKIISEGTPIGAAMGVFVRLKLLTILLFLALGFSWVHFLQDIFLGGSFSPKQKIIIDLSLLTIVGHQLTKFGNTTFQAKMEQVKANIPDLIKGILFQLGRVLVVLLGSAAVGLIAWDLVTSLISALFTLKLLRKLPIERFNKTLAMHYWSYAKPLILFSIVTVSVKFLDKVLLKELTSETELGFYTVAFSLGGGLLMIKSQIGVTFFPLFARFISEGANERLADVVSKYLNLVLFIVFPIITGLIIASKQIIIVLYGIQYEPSVSSFIILTISSFVTLLGQPFGNIISGAGKFYQLTTVNTIKAIIFFIALYFMVSDDFLSLGSIGLSLAVLLGQIVEFITFQVYASRISPGEFWRKTHFKSILILVILLTSMWTQSMLGFSNNLWSFVFAFVITIVIFVVLSFIGVINQKLIDDLKELKSFKKLKIYTLKEFNKS
jgi:O-antigen/teichoic acid export membrane protein